eukprot:TRINITY_DN55766_c0_g1_i1.p1 TRINITY_DN55766_c0_g1~~TRINITY_DN55766_c0_g1_i1.p1  ORF type:complete len:411 (+),score=49.07 TRINITY_DN55766_c0_g1_i1:119-1234(+)
MVALAHSECHLRWNVRPSVATWLVKRVRGGQQHWTETTVPQPQKLLASNAHHIIDSVAPCDFGVSQSTCCESLVEVSDDDSSSEQMIDDSLQAERAPGAQSCSSSLASLGFWFQPEETLIFLDFDDTIFPSTWLEQESRSLKALSFESASTDYFRSVDSVAAASLARHEAVVSSFLRTAASLAGEVTIVTLGTQTWVESCMNKFMPGLWDELAKLDINISYARKAASDRRVRGALLEGLDVLPLLKRMAMRKALKRFYSRRPKQSWKNCISIGDSDIEREALEELTFRRIQRSQSGKQKFVRCKTVKFLDSPSIDELTSELELMISNLSALVHYDGDLSYDVPEDSDREVTLHGLLSNGSTPHAGCTGVLT